MPDFKQDEGLESIKTPVVIGETVGEEMLLSEHLLEMRALKIKDTGASFKELQTEIITDKVVIQGTIHNQVFYVGIDEIIRYQDEEINFSTFVNIPGIEPEMELMLEPSIEHIVSKLRANGDKINQKIVLRFFVKAFSLQELIVETGTGPLVKTQKLIGEKSHQTMLENEMVLPSPADKIVNVISEIRDLETDAAEDKVIIQGIVNVKIFFVGKNNAEYCQSKEIQFNKMVDIPGAETGINVQVYPGVEHIESRLNSEGTIINQEILLELFVKATETVQINLVTGEDSLVMVPEVIGENLKQIFKEITINLNQIAIKIKKINVNFKDIKSIIIKDKVIIQGTVNIQIFYIGEDNAQYRQVEKAPFSTFTDIVGARPGMNVDIHPSIAFVDPDLSSTGDILIQKVIGDIFVKITENIQFNISEISL